MRFPLAFNLCHPGAAVAMGIVKQLVYDYFWQEFAAERDDAVDHWLPPFVCEVAGFSHVMGRTYVAAQRPPYVYEGIPYIHVYSKFIRIRRVTDVCPIYREKFRSRLNSIAAAHPDIFKVPETPPFSDATPECIREILTQKPELRYLVDKVIHAGAPPLDITGGIDLQAHIDVQYIINGPDNEDIAGMLSLDQYRAMVEHGGTVA